MTAIAVSAPPLDPEIDRAWGEFLVFASINAEGWLFRGHSKRRFDLIPKAGRADICGPGGYVERKERTIADEFRTEASGHIDMTLDPLDWLAVAQHHGLPTRLLDWTTNPLVAAWFALRSEDLDEPEIHAIRVQARDRHSSVDPWSPSAPVTIVRVPARAARITAQQGCFSLHRYPDEVWDPSGTGVPHRRHPLMADGRDAFLRRLKIFGIDDARMMADLDGIGADLAWTYRRTP